MTSGNNEESGSFSGQMKSLNLDVPEFNADFKCMSFRQLADAKRSVETSLDHLFGLLKNTYKFDMTLPLVVDGFPRSDIDVVTVRLIRSKIVRLRNDHTAILDRLQEHLSQQLQPPTNLANDKGSLGDEIVDPTYKELNINALTFALVRDVIKGSPAEKAGLLIGDRILTFDGDIDIHNHQNLAAVGTRVKDRKGAKIVVEVVRNANRKSLLLVPSEDWPGRGLLGCHIVPI